MAIGSGNTSNDEARANLKAKNPQFKDLGKDEWALLNSNERNAYTERGGDALVFADYENVERVNLASDVDGESEVGSKISKSVAQENKTMTSVGYLLNPNLRNKKRKYKRKKKRKNFTSDSSTYLSSLSSDDTSAEFLSPIPYPKDSYIPSSEKLFMYDANGKLIDSLDDAVTDHTSKDFASRLATSPLSLNKEISTLRLENDCSKDKKHVPKVLVYSRAYSGGDSSTPIPVLHVPSTDSEHEENKKIGVALTVPLAPIWDDMADQAVPVKTSGSSYSFKKE